LNSSNSDRKNIMDTDINDRTSQSFIGIKSRCNVPSFFFQKNLQECVENPGLESMSESIGTLMSNQYSILAPSHNSSWVVRQDILTPKS